MSFGSNGVPMDSAHWLVVTQGLLLLVVLLPMVAVLAAKRSAGSPRPRAVLVRRAAPGRPGRTVRERGEVDLGEHPAGARALNGKPR